MIVNMVTKFNLSNLILFLIFCQLAFTDVVKYTVYHCQKTELHSCGIKYVYVNPCEVTPDGSISVDLGANLTVSFNFMPDFTTKNLRWKILGVSLIGDWPMKGVDENGCHFAHCPIAAHRNNNFTATFQVPTTLRPKNYVIKVMLTNGDIATDNCCFLTDVNLRKPLTTRAVNPANTSQPIPSGQVDDMTYEDKTTTPIHTGYFSFLKNKFNSWIGKIGLSKNASNQTATYDGAVADNVTMVGNKTVANDEAFVSNNTIIGNETNVNYENLVLGNETTTVNETLDIETVTESDITVSEITEADIETIEKMSSSEATEAPDTNTTVEITSSSNSVTESTPAKVTLTTQEETISQKDTTAQKKTTIKKETASITETTVIKETTAKEEPTVASTTTKATTTKPTITTQKEAPTPKETPKVAITTTKATTTKPTTTLQTTQKETPTATTKEKPTVASTTTKDTTTKLTTTTQKETPVKKEEPTTTKVTPTKPSTTTQKETPAKTEELTVASTTKKATVTHKTTQATKTK